MLMRGTTARTRQQIQDELDRLKARMSVSGGATQANASVETTRENLPAVLRLLGEVLREPGFPAAEFEPLKQERLAAIEQQKSEPTQVAFTAFNRHLGPYPKGDVRYTKTPEEQIAEIQATTLQAATQFYRDFYGGSHGELTVVGDFDQKEIAGLATELFGKWKSPRPFTRVPSVFVDAPAVNESFATPDKANAVFVAGINLRVRDDHADYPALLIGNYMLGGGFLNSRLATRLRQKDGLSYGVGSGLNVSSLDQYGRFTASAIYAPENVEKLEAAFIEEIDRMLKDGFTAGEVTAAKSGYLQGRQVSRAQDAELAGRLNTFLFLDRTLEWDASFGEQDQGADARTDQRGDGAPSRVEPAHHHEGRRLQGGALSCARGSRSLTSPASLDYVPRRERETAHHAYEAQAEEHQKHCGVFPRSICRPHVNQRRSVTPPCRFT